jgi:hypothetical protein
VTPTEWNALLDRWTDEHMDEQDGIQARDDIWTLVEYIRTMATDQVLEAALRRFRS